MKPKEILFGYRGEICEAARSGRRVLRDGIAAARRAIEADAVGGRAMVVIRSPLRALEIVDPRRRAVVVPRAHQMRETERRHVVDDGLTRAQHDGKRGVDKLRVA